jgi:putative transposase
MTNGKTALHALLVKGSALTFRREMIGFAAERPMKLETESLCNAALGERAPEQQNQRNGCRDRDWQTPAGAVKLRVPKLAPWQLLPRLTGA